MVNEAKGLLVPLILELIALSPITNERNVMALNHV